MKKIQVYKYLIATVVIVLIQSLALAQPLPPESPGGNPMPVGGIITLLLASATILGVRQLKKKK